MKVLVTGGAGYIGSHICLALAAAQHEPVVLDNLSTGRREAVQWGPLIQGDIRSADDLAKAFANGPIHAVIHCAGRLSVAESLQDPLGYASVNLDGTQCLIRAMQAHHTRYCVFSSSAAVYGTPDYMPIAETTPCQPITPYGETKYAAEQALAQSGIHTASLRYFNACGADAQQRARWYTLTNLVPILVTALAQNRPIQVFGTDYPTPDGTCVRDYIHVSDLADAHLRALTYIINTGQSLTANLGTGQGTSVVEIIRTLETVAGQPVPYTTAPRRLGDPPCLIADSRYAQQVLDWHPRRTLHTMIHDAYQSV